MACCMLWVTMMMVTRCLSSPTSSSIRLVAMGSRAEVGSSINSTSGSTARARAMHSRCCSPPDRVLAWAFSRSRTLSHRAAPIRADSAASSRRAFLRTPLNRRPATAFS